MTIVEKEKEGVEARLLSYKFTEEELKELALTLARKNQEAAAVEKEKKAVTSEYKSKQDLIISEIGLLSNKVSTGQMIKEIDCKVQWHTPVAGIKTLTRQDVQESWEERMTDAEWNLFNAPDSPFN